MIECLFVALIHAIGPVDPLTTFETSENSLTSKQVMNWQNQWYVY